MDSLTQIVLGAAVGEAILGKKVGNKAILWGAIGGTIPDLDVVMKLFVDNLTATEMHRSFSHSFLFCFMFAPIFGWIISKIDTKDGVNWKGWSWLMFGALVTHPLLDAHTNWGTMLFWPLQYKVAYNNIFIIDPLYTIPFMICVIWAMTLARTNPKRRRINNAGLILSCSYMLFTLIAKGIGYKKFSESLQNQDINYIELDTNPTPFNSILWSARVETTDEYLIGYYSLLDDDKDVQFTAFDKTQNFPGNMKAEEISQRLIKLSGGWYLTQQYGDTTYVRDLRFGQFKMNDEPSGFAFAHKIWYKNGVLQVKPAPRPSSDEMKESLSKVFNRIVHQ